MAALTYEQSSGFNKSWMCVHRHSNTCKFARYWNYGMWFVHMRATVPHMCSTRYVDGCSMYRNTSDCFFYCFRTVCICCMSLCVSFSPPPTLFSCILTRTTVVVHVRDTHYTPSPQSLAQHFSILFSFHHPRFSIEECNFDLVASSIKEEMNEALGKNKNWGSSEPLTELLFALVCFLWSPALPQSPTLFQPLFQLHIYVFTPLLQCECTASLGKKCNQWQIYILLFRLKSNSKWVVKILVPCEGGPFFRWHWWNAKSALSHHLRHTPSVCTVHIIHLY